MVTLLGQKSVFLKDLELRQTRMHVRENVLK
jgi:hypothetical protein